MEERYSRNIPAISLEEQRLLGEKHALVVGCGGLGGYLIQNLVRAGVGHITAVDGDVFEESNLNRQVLSSVPVLGKSKAHTARETALAIRPGMDFRAVEAFLDEHNADDLVRDADLVLDALDNVPARLLLEEACARRGVWLVHGAVSHWSAQVCLVPPGSGLLRTLYGGGIRSRDKSVLPMVPPFCAALETAEALKLLCGRESALAGRLLMADLRDMDMEIVDL